LGNRSSSKEYRVWYKYFIDRFLTIHFIFDLYGEVVKICVDFRLIYGDIN